MYVYICVYIVYPCLVSECSVWNGTVKTNTQLEITQNSPLRENVKN